MKPKVGFFINVSTPAEENHLLSLVRADGTLVTLEPGGQIEYSSPPGYLEPLEEVAFSGQTFAERLIEKWKGELQFSSDRYVEAYQVN